PKAIYLNRNGRTYRPGDDDSAAGLSSVVKEEGLSSARIPRLSWSDNKWRQFAQCMADEFSRFNIKVTTVRPTASAGPYVEAAIGGNGAEVGLPGGVLGVAPVDDQGCVPIAGAVVFIFADNPFSGSAVTNCETAAQEAGHSLVPLDHELLASDPM